MLDEAGAAFDETGAMFDETGAMFDEAGAYQKGMQLTHSERAAHPFLKNDVFYFE